MDQPDRTHDTDEISRRALIASTAFVPLAALTASAQQARQAAAPQALSAAQRRTLEAFIDRLIPRDELGPGAVDAGAQIYIDRALAGPNAAEKDAFAAGLEAVDAYARRAHGAPLAELSAAQRDQVLTEIDNGTAQGLPGGRQFFSRARRLTLEGMFGDPYHGGNRNFAGWDLIRYPGPRPAVGPEEQRMDKAPTPYRRSAYGARYR
jgi:gluconate 2-dehydrogenase gamma chain